MAHVIVFPHEEAFRQGLQTISDSEPSVRVLPPPRFCESLVAPSVLVSGVGGTRALQEKLASAGVPVSGVIPYAPFKKRVPEAAPPDPRWQPILGRMHLVSVRPSVSDQLRLRIDAVWENNIGDHIRRMARGIRGGSYRPNMPALAFEEDHRLVAITPLHLVISRADDMLDAWILLRSFIDLLNATAVRAKGIKPDTRPRRGIGSVEIFRRLPATNCSACGCPNCMEFAMRLFMGRSRVAQCTVLAEAGWSAHREDLEWLMDLIGPTTSSDAPESVPPTATER
jgi:ArsR family metal-binding transcriptional regulator